MILLMSRVRIGMQHTADAGSARRCTRLAKVARCTRSRTLYCRLALRGTVSSRSAVQHVSTVFETRRQGLEPDSRAEVITRILGRKWPGNTRSPADKCRTLLPMRESSSWRSNQQDKVAASACLSDTDRDHEHLRTFALD